MSHHWQNPHGAKSALLSFVGGDMECRWLGGTGIAVRFQDKKQ